MRMLGGARFQRARFPKMHDLYHFQVFFVVLWTRRVVDGEMVIVKSQVGGVLSRIVDDVLLLVDTFRPKMGIRARVFRRTARVRPSLLRRIQPYP